LKVFSGNANRPLAEKMCKHLGIPLGDALVTRFADGEIRVKIQENVRGEDVFVVQSTHPPAENILELLLLIDALRRASADRITAVIPYYGYARQDKKDEPRVPISSKLLANLIASAGADRVLTMDLHATQIQGFFDIPVDQLYSTPVLVDYFKKDLSDDFIVASPDVGGVPRTRAFAKRLGNLPLVIIDKRRPEPNRAEVCNVIGDVEGKRCLIFDDIIDTGGTLIDAARAILEKGAKEVMASATHPLLSSKASERLFESPISKVVVTDTIPLPEEKRNPKISILSIAGLLAEAVKRIHNSESVSSLFI